MPQQSRIESIEAGRAFAAIIVLFYHLDHYYFDSARFWHESVLGGVFSVGHAGVEFFFVLSGLIITLMHADDVGRFCAGDQRSRPARAASFIKRRIARIYPLYWLCLALMATRMLAAPVGESTRPVEAAVASLLLVGATPHEGPLLVGWTLFHEMLFYALFALVIWRPRLGIALMIAWFAAIAVLGSADGSGAYPFRLNNLLFGLGVAAGLALRRWMLPAPAMIALSGAAIFGLAAAHELWSGLRGLPLQIAGYGIGAALLLAGLIALERRHGLRPPAVLRRIGEASYSIYLTHMLVLPPLVLAARFAGATAYLPAPLAFAMLAAAALACGFAVHIIIETRLARLARALFDRPLVPMPRSSGRMAHPQLQR